MYAIYMFKKLFRYNYKIYGVNETNGVYTTCWAHDLRSGNNTNLGVHNGEQVKEHKHLRTLPWDLQKGAERLFKIVEKLAIGGSFSMRQNPNLSMIMTVKQLRTDGYSYRAISQMLDQDLKSVFRWSKYKNVSADLLNSIEPPKGLSFVKSIFGR